jgi:hypothetical protein
VGNVPLVAMTVLAALPLTWWTHRAAADETGARPLAAGAAASGDAADGDRPVPWRAAAWGVGLAALMWLPAVIEQISADDGNLGRILSDLGRDEPRMGLGAAAGLSSRFFGPLPAWIDQRSLVLQIAETGWVAPIWLVVPVVAFVVAWRRGDRTYLRGLAIGAAGVASTAVAAAAIKGVVFSYLVVGHRSIVAVVMAMSIAALARALPAPRRVQIVLALGAVAIVAAVAIGVFQWSARNPSQPFDATVRAVTEAVEQEAGGDPVFITSTDDDPSRDVASGLLLQLERAGVPATTVRGEDWRMGAHRTSDGGRDGVLEVKVVPVGQEQVLADEGYRVLLEYQPLDPDEVAELDRLVAARDAAIAQGEQAGPDDPDAAARFATVQELAAQIDALRGDRISTVVGVRRSPGAAG